MLSEIFRQERGTIFTIVPDFPADGNIRATINMTDKSLTFHTNHGEVTTVFNLNQFRYCRLFKMFYLHFDHPYNHSKLFIEVPRLSKRDQTISEHQIFSTSIFPKLGKIGYTLYLNNTYKLQKN